MKKLYINILLSVFVFTSCEPTQLAEFIDRPVVDALLYAGDPVIINISKLIPFRDDAEFSSEDINALDISVTDITSNIVYKMNSAGDGNYVNSDLIAKSGHEYSLSFIYDNIPVLATTKVPDMPTGMRLTKTVIYVRGYTDFAETKVEQPGEITPVELIWDNPDHSYYVISFINESSNPTQIWNSDTPPETAFQMDPTTDSTAFIQDRGFSYYGIHKVVLSKIEPEYLIMCRNLETNSGSMREVNANIINGYGIFTGMSRDIRTLTIVRSN